MMTQIHEIEIRFKCILKTLHGLLNFVLKFAVEKHEDDCKTAPDLDTRLAKIIFNPSNKSKFEKKKMFVEDRNYRKHFYGDDKNNSNKAKVAIENLDVTVLSNMITLPFMCKKSFYKYCQCCVGCKHTCKCGQDFLFNKKCSDKSNCPYDACRGCTSSEPCEYMEIIKFVKIL